MSRTAAHTTVPRRRWSIARAGALGLAVNAALLGSVLTASSVGDIHAQIATRQSAAASLKSQISADTAQLQRTTGSLRSAQDHLTALQSQLGRREAELRTVHSQLLSARDHLVALENRLHLASSALATNLVASYENQQPDLVTMVLEAHGFSELLERLNFLHRIGTQDAQVVSFTRHARVAVRQQVGHLATLEQRDRVLTSQILVQRNQVAALQVALLRRQLSELHAKQGDAARLRTLDSQIHTLEARAAAQAARAAVTGNVDVGGIGVDTGGMVQPPAGAPAAVGEIIAAGNAIATLPYIYGGGHASFQASGYDCSGSVSYVLAAAGLLSAPMVSGDFENWGGPGPGRWVTIYANAGHVWMTVAGWRFDTVALAEGGTRWAQGGGEFAGFVVRHPPGL
jgi:cell wall-associated NlpC family hydrolase